MASLNALGSSGTKFILFIKLMAEYSNDIIFCLVLFLNIPNL
jgi:hypothetical protein